MTRDLQAAIWRNLMKPKDHPTLPSAEDLAAMPAETCGGMSAFLAQHGVTEIHTVSGWKPLAEWVPLGSMTRGPRTFFVRRYGDGTIAIEENGTGPVGLWRVR